MDFMEQMFCKAKCDRRTIVLPETEDLRILQAASICLGQKMANIVLVGEPKSIKARAGELSLEDAMFVNPEDDKRTGEYAKTLYELRKNKGMTLHTAQQEILDPMVFAVMMVKKHDADGMVAGATHSTADTLRPALQILKTAEGTSMVSSFFMMEIPDCSFGYEGLFLFADCGLIEDPNAQVLADIAVASADSFEMLTEQQPIVAMLSYSTYCSAQSELVQKVQKATELAQRKAPQRLIDGELQADAAIVPQVGRSKAPKSKIAGKANVLVFPDLNSGNICYKMVQRLAKAKAYGPITQGLAKPVNDLSRGCSVDDIVGVIAVTCVQAQSQKGDSL